MTKECAIEMLRYVKAFKKRWPHAFETACEYQKFAGTMAVAAGMTFEEINKFMNEQISTGTAYQILEKYDKPYDSAGTKYLSKK